MRGKTIREGTSARPPKDRRDLLTAGVTLAAVVLVVASGFTVAGSLLRSFRGELSVNDNLMISVLLLNVALSLLGWRRYRALKGEVALRRAAEAKASELATSDPLTGLLNRRALAEGGTRLIERALGRDKSVAMLMIDLDHFKSVNDLHGHLAGDQLLRAASDAIVAPLPADALAARLGGDEFACAVLFDPSQPMAIDRIADDILARMAQPFLIGGVEARIGASMGIARTEPGCRTVDTLMRRSDIALYAAKRAGRNQRAWFDASMERELELRNEIELGLRAGIPAGQIVPWFEPQVDLATGALIGFELLARWEHPELGILEPSLFIPIAEESGLIGELSMSVMRAGIEEARHWDPSLRLGVNISPSQMRDSWLAQKIVKLLSERGFPAERLEVEITEAALFENLGFASAIVGSLRNQGVRVVLDDFGTGYSSLTHLRALPLDRIKIDRSFVLRMAEDADAAALVRMIVSLAQSLGVPAMAEGVENAEIATMLGSIACPTAQGWHFGRPAPARATRALLAERGLLNAASPSAKAGALTMRQAARRKRA
ncbi:putative bifunctional diguanylate cyclase/phosphodiesterase [Rhizorhabdus dicambivorans]|uniref:GGDEF-domain containing protein n=1 Tax=Rhizorhabdus dicambivorans TaxID=1850238 RepID=A0A2A4G1I8_9SPHN|nr:EAL domain-containing protein [Rhizorhabdus dicambivorans]ATE63374.1 GGDEF-domain containing protein [Rhizorhabdus dicambivorans]PCE43590.1 GGDEF-domain containing protein [Rhizorhabdus dicambivorans]